MEGGEGGGTFSAGVTVHALPDLRISSPEHVIVSFIYYYHLLCVNSRP